jgi:hypothetical protein
MLFSFYLAKDFKLRFASSILTSFAFGLNSYMIGLLEFGSDAHTIIWWPLSLLFAKRFLDKQQRRYLCFLGLTIALSILAGQLQYFGYFILFFFAFILYYGRSIQVKAGTYLLLFLSLSLGIGLSAIQLVPSIELFHNSHRGLLSQSQIHSVFSRGLNSPDRLFRLLSPDFFGNPVSQDMTNGYIESSGFFGVIPLFFSFFALIFARNQKIVKFLTWAFLLSLLFSLQGIGELLYMLKIPLITSGEASRVFTIVLLSGALLSGFGLEEFIAMKSHRKRLVSIGLFLLADLSVVGGYAFSIKQNIGFLIK